MRSPDVDLLAGECPRSLEADAAAANLLALLRAGEQSAQHAFARMARRLPAAAAAQTRAVLAGIEADEVRHDRWLARSADVAGLIQVKPPPTVRRFFLRLESREIGVHLLRIAALDACVCQMLAAVLRDVGRPGIPAPMARTLGAIRRDEGRHVRASRNLAQQLAIETSLWREVCAETRTAFDAVLVHYEPSLHALGVDGSQLRQRIRRDET